MRLYMPIGSVGGISDPYFPENVESKTEGDYRDKIVKAYTAIVLYVLVHLLRCRMPISLT